VKDRGFRVDLAGLEALQFTSISIYTSKYSAYYAASSLPVCSLAGRTDAVVKARGFRVDLARQEASLYISIYLYIYIYIYVYIHIYIYIYI